MSLCVVRWRCTIHVSMSPPHASSAILTIKNRLNRLTTACRDPAEPVRDWATYCQLAIKSCDQVPPVTSHGPLAEHSARADRKETLSCTALSGNIFWTLDMQKCNTQIGSNFIVMRWWHFPHYSMLTDLNDRSSVRFIINLHLIFQSPL